VTSRKLFRFTHSSAPCTLPLATPYPQTVGIPLLIYIQLSQARSLLISGGNFPVSVVTSEASTCTTSACGCVSLLARSEILKLVATNGKIFEVCHDQLFDVLCTEAQKGVSQEMTLCVLKQLDFSLQRKR
jgi:hypothetical protein